MAVHNVEIAAIFNQLADLLEIKSENPFRIRAYRNAARIIGGLSKDVSVMINEGTDLTEIPSIGNDLADKIRIIVQTGSLPLLKQWQKKVPPVLSNMLKIEGLGPKRVKILYDKLHIRNVEELRKAIIKGKVRKIKGFGEKIEQKILASIANVEQYSKRMLLVDVIPIATSLTHYLEKLPPVKKACCAGSFRRRKETVGDLDFVVDAKDQKKVIDKFTSFNEVAKILSSGGTRAAVRLSSGVQVDLRVVNSNSYGAAMLYFTGSKAHNISLRKIAIKKKLKLNEYGLYKGTKQLAGKTEKSIYDALGLKYIEPEMREDRGEIELAKENKLPKLITLEDIRGDLHCHTKATDGKSSIEEMANRALELGYEYIAITDHSKHLTVAKGLDEKRLKAQIKEIDRINNQFGKIIILKSIELDILEDGSLNLSNDILKELDFTVCAIHSKFNLSAKKQEERIIRAMDNPYFTILAHPTGRIINRREPYQINLERIMRAAKERGCFLELNAQPERMDLADTQCQLAKEMGVKLAISTDAHTQWQLNNMQFGIYQARRGWLEKGDVINTYSLNALRKLFKR